MKAVMLDRYGDGVDMLTLREVPEPPMGPSDVLVDVHAAGFNPFECKLRKGWLQRFYPFPLPHVLGNDFAGIVVACGPAVFGLQAGDKVYGMQETMRWGSYAERIVIRADHLRRMPANLSFVEAASLPMVYQTTWMALVDMARLRPGERLLVHGGAGGVGHAAVQLGRVLGATVAATCSADAVDLVREAGAHVAIDRRAVDFTRLLSGIDVVFDPIGGQTNLDSYLTMSRGGRICVVQREDRLEIENSERLCREHGVARLVVAFEQRADVLDYIRPLFEAGQLRPCVRHVLPLAAAAEAHRRSDGGKARGKTVLQVR